MKLLAQIYAFEPCVGCDSPSMPVYIRSLKHIAWHGLQGQGLQGLQGQGVQGLQGQGATHSKQSAVARLVAYGRPALHALILFYSDPPQSVTDADREEAEQAEIVGQEMEIAAMYRQARARDGYPMWS